MQRPSVLAGGFLRGGPGRVRDGRGRIKRIAITALARKLLVALWRFVTHGLVPTGAVLKPAQAG